MDGLLHSGEERVPGTRGQALRLIALSIELEL